MVAKAEVRTLWLRSRGAYVGALMFIAGLLRLKAITDAAAWDAEPD